MKNLNRTKVGNFNIKNAITIEELKEKIDDKQFMDKYFISVENMFIDCNKIILNDRELKLFLNGVMLTKENSDAIYRNYNNNKFIGTGILKAKLLKRDIIL